MHNWLGNTGKRKKDKLNLNFIISFVAVIKHIENNFMTVWFM